MRLLLERLAHEERGAMMVVVIGFLPVAIALGAFVIDAANGFEHRRHLQLQADAGVLAAAQEMTRCFTDPAGANAAITAQAGAYSGAVVNAQVGGPAAQARVRTVLNGSGYDSVSGSEGLPCDTGIIDLKLTEQDSPAFFASIDPFDVHAHARVEALRLQSSERLLPIAAEDPVPRSAKAIFVNEATGEVLASTPLQANGSDGDLSILDNSSAPVSVPITAEHVGVRIALSGKSSVGDCGDALVACYDAGDPGSGHPAHPRLVGEPARSAGTTPPHSALRDAHPGDMRGRVLQRALRRLLGRRRRQGGVRRPRRRREPLGHGREGPYPMAYDPTVGTWSSGAVVPVAADSGPVSIGLEWEQKTRHGRRGHLQEDGWQPVQGQLRDGAAHVQRDARPLRPDRARRGPPGTTAGANSFERCSAVQSSCTVSLVVKIGIKGALALSEPDDPPVRLRVVGGSQNQSLDCDPATSNLKDELAHGCRTRYYGRNTGTACPGSQHPLGDTRSRGSASRCRPVTPPTRSPRA